MSPAGVTRKKHHGRSIVHREAFLQVFLFTGSFLQRNCATTPSRDELSASSYRRYGKSLSLRAGEGEGCVRTWRPGSSRGPPDSSPRDLSSPWSLGVSRAPFCPGLWDGAPIELAPPGRSLCSSAALRLGTLARCEIWNRNYNSRLQATLDPKEAVSRVLNIVQ